MKTGKKSCLGIFDIQFLNLIVDYSSHVAITLKHSHQCTEMYANAYNLNV